MVTEHKPHRRSPWGVTNHQQLLHMRPLCGQSHDPPASSSVGQVQECQSLAAKRRWE